MCVCVCWKLVGVVLVCLSSCSTNPPSLQACTIALSNPIMADRDSTWLYHTLLWLYLTLVHLPGMTLCEITRLYHSSTWLYITLPHSTVALLDSIWVYHTLPCLYLILKSTMAIPDSTTFYLYRELCIHDKYIEHPKKCTLFLTVYKDSPPVNPPTNGDISTLSTVDICPANPPVNDTRVNSEPHYRPTHQQWNSCDRPTNQQWNSCDRPTHQHWTPHYCPTPQQWNSCDQPTHQHWNPHYRPTHQQWNSCEQPTHQHRISHYCPTHQQWRPSLYRSQRHWRHSTICDMQLQNTLLPESALVRESAVHAVNVGQAEM